VTVHDSDKNIYSPERNFDQLHVLHTQGSQQGFLFFLLQNCTTRIEACRAEDRPVGPRASLGFLGGGQSAPSQPAMGCGGAL